MTDVQVRYTDVNLEPNYVGYHRTPPERKADEDWVKHCNMKEENGI